MVGISTVYVGNAAAPTVPGGCSGAWPGLRSTVQAEAAAGPAGPGRASRPTDQVEDAAGSDCLSKPSKRRPPRGLQGLAGLRDDAPSRRLVARTASGRAGPAAAETHTGGWARRYPKHGLAPQIRSSRATKCERVPQNRKPSSLRRASACSGPVHKMPLTPISSAARTFSRRSSMKTTSSTGVPRRWSTSR